MVYTVIVPVVSEGERGGVHRTQVGVYIVRRNVVTSLLLLLITITITITNVAGSSVLVFSFASLLLLFIITTIIAITTTLVIIRGRGRQDARVVVVVDGIYIVHATI